MDEKSTKKGRKAKSRLAGALTDLLSPAIENRAKQQDIAEKTGISPATLKDWRAGRSLPQVDKFIEVMRAAGFDPAAAIRAAIEPVAPRPTPVPDTVPISLLDVRAAAGTGSFNDQVREVETIEWPRAFLRKLGANARTTDSLRADGDSMAPTIESGAFMLIDRSQNALPAQRQHGRARMPDVFVFVQGKSLRVKRVERVDDNWIALISDNFALHPPEVVRAGDVKIIGRVVWWDNRL